MHQKLDQDGGVGLLNSGSDCWQSFTKANSPQQEFANQHGVGLSSLSRWLRLERDAVPPKVKFQEVPPSLISRSTTNSLSKIVPSDQSSDSAPATCEDSFGNRSSPFLPLNNLEK
jgi:hypothetical protein